MKKKAIYFTAIVLASFMLIVTAFVAALYSVPTDAETEYKEISLTDIGKPVFAGTGKSSFDEDTLYYSSGNTVGYNVDMQASLLTADYTFKDMAFPSWFSVTLKASRVDRHYSQDLGGYTFIIMPSGQVQVVKDGVQIVTASIDAIKIYNVYRITLGAVNEGNNVRILMSIGGAEIINFIDSDNAYLSGEWINFCGEGTVEAQIKSINRASIIDYPTYTLNTLQCYPIVTGTSSMPEADDDNRIETFDASNCVGFNLHLQNYSFEAKFNFKSFEAGRFGIALRMSSFNRVHGSDGYSAWFYQYGRVELYRKTELIASSVCVPVVPKQDYIIEMGTVDVSDGKTNVFVSVDNTTYIDFLDENAIQQPGFLNMNAEGNVSFEATSADTKISVGNVSIINEQETTSVCVDFINNFSLDSLVYAEFSDETLSSIIINGTSVFDLNSICSNSSGGRAIDVKFTDNQLKIIIYNELYLENGDVYNLGDIRTLELKKTRNDGGFTPPSGLILKQSYYKLFV